MFVFQIGFLAYFHKFHGRTCLFSLLQIVVFSCMQLIASAYTRRPKLVKFTESNRIVVFDKHVCVSGSSICSAYLPYAAMIPSETHRQRV